MASNRPAGGDPLIRFKLELAYEGTRYAGFQYQVNALTVQAELEKALALLFGRAVRVIAAGRTDSGVHARGQVVAFDAPRRIPAQSLAAACNSVLPSDIRVLAAGEAGEQFHPRFQAVGKLYTYRIDRGPWPDIFMRRFAWHHPAPIDLSALQRAASLLVGRHDFRAFQSAGSTVRDTVRRLRRLDVEQQGALLLLHLEADGFLYKMARSITGTLVDIGTGRLPPDSILPILHSGDRRLAGRTAPAHGLCLEKVFYQS